MSAEYPNESDWEAVTGSATDEHGWTWGFKKLQHLLIVAHGSASQGVINFTRQYLSGVKFVLVFGETGVGKTSLLEEIAGKKLLVGNSINSGTKKYEIHATVIEKEQYLFMDTPGFGATDIDDVSNYVEIIKALIAFSSVATFAGVLFLHDSKSDRLTKSETQTLRWLQCFAGPAAFCNVVFVTTKWDVHKPKELLKARSRNIDLMASENVNPFLFPPPPFQGATWYNHGIPGGGIKEEWEEALEPQDDLIKRSFEIHRVINTRFRKTKVAKLQVMREIEDDINPMDTTARIALTADPFATHIELDRGNAKVVENIGADADSTSRQEDEYDPRRQRQYRNSTPIEDFLSSFDAIRPWYDIAKQMAVVFMKLREGGKDEAQKGYWAAIWAAIKDWWSGPVPPI